MSRKIDQSQIRKVAKLARLELTEAEVDDVEPLAHCLPISNVFRDDCVTESLGTEKTLANAPQRDGEFFKVPKILDGGSGS